MNKHLNKQNMKTVKTGDYICVFKVINKSNMK